ncbi:MAG TPA: low temperature requirement protein A [Acidimicrobiales bacterium]|nr:low temperature requirement protein A [Acidimicrobiales bacterium]
MTNAPQLPRVGVVLREGETVSPLELFFDLVFVLAITQCTALMVEHPTWTGIGRGLIVLGLLWWSWVGYAWLTSVVDPEEGFVRLSLFASMGALLVAALCVPDAFGDHGVTLAIAYGVFRAGQILVFLLASRNDPQLRHSVLGLALSTFAAAVVLVGGAFLDSGPQAAVWLGALALDMVAPMFIDTRGWRFEPAHFAERHGLIVIVALGESIVAIGAGAGSEVDGGVIVAAVLGIAVVAGFWWAYFDVSSILAARRLAAVEDERERNELARDAYSYLHLPMVAGIVLVAFGLRVTLTHVGDPLGWEAATALVGGTALYLLAVLAFKRRTIGRFSGQRLVGVAVVVPIIPLSHRIDAGATLALVATVLWALFAYEAVRFAEARNEARHAGHAHDTA